MIVATIDWLSISINLLLLLFVLTALLMSLLILMQRPKQEGLGAAFGSGMTDQMFGARTTNVLQKGTVYLGSLFFILTLTLAILFARKNERESANTMVADEPAAEEQVEEPALPEPVEETPSLEESLQGKLTEDDPATAGGADTTEPEGAVEEGEAGSAPAADDESGAVVEEPADEEAAATPSDEGETEPTVEDAAEETAPAQESGAAVGEEEPAVETEQP